MKISWTNLKHLINVAERQTCHLYCHFSWSIRVIERSSSVVSEHPLLHTVSFYTKGLQTNCYPQPYCSQSHSLSAVSSPRQHVPFPQLLSYDGILTRRSTMTSAQNKPIGNCYWLLSAGYFPNRPVLQFSQWEMSLSLQLWTFWCSHSNSHDLWGVWRKGHNSRRWRNLW